MTRKSSGDRQADYRERMKERGFVQISFLVPADRADLFKRLAARFRRQCDQDSAHD